MKLGDYLSLSRTRLIEATAKEPAIEELAAALCSGEPRLDYRKTLNAVLERERSVSSRIAPQVALPHALLPGYDGQVVAVGYSPEGIPWDSPGGQRVNLIVMSLCGESRAGDHLGMLASLAQTLRDPGLLPRLETARSAEDVFEVLQGPAVAAQAGTDARKLALCRSVVAHAHGMARELRASAIILLADESVPLEQIGAPGGETPLIVAMDDTGGSVASVPPIGSVLPVPFQSLARSHRVKLAFLFALSHGLVDKGDTVICVSGDPGGGALYALEIVDVADEFNVLLSLRHELANSDIASHVLDRVLHIAAAIAREGREGKPVGTLFVLGDYENVRARCHQLVMNPFRGCPENERSVLDPSLEETIKEFSRIDGAFLIRGNGIIMTTGSYIQTDNAASELEPGLGARHTAGMAITASTGALSIVISESTRRISIYQRGALVMTLDQASK